MLASLDRTRTSPAAAPRAATRVHAALTALAFVLSSLLGLIHEATTTHVRCAEHGELVDGGPSAIPERAALANPSAAFPDEGRGAQVRGTATTAKHGHEHCSLASTLRESRLVPRTPVVVPAPGAVGDLAAALPRAAATHHRDLYRTAPKTSPPV